MQTCASIMFPFFVRSSLVTDRTLTRRYRLAMKKTFVSDKPPATSPFIAYFGNHLICLLSLSSLILLTIYSVHTYICSETLITHIFILKFIVY